MTEKGIGFITTTYKLRLYDRHHDWLENTQQIYHQVVWYYYQILIQESSLLKQSSFLLLRELEKLSVGTKKMRVMGEEPVWKLEEHLKMKVPLYFRRAAINAAIGLARSYQTSLENWYMQPKQGKGIPSQAHRIHCSPVLYKQMYREFGEKSIQIKVFNGKKWVWVTYPYTGRKIPKEGNVLSPTLKVEKKAAYLHVPVKKKIEDIYTIRERLKQETKICAVAFPDSDTLAVCVSMKKDGSVIDDFFIHGGKEREGRRKEVLDRLEKSRRSRKNIIQKTIKQDDIKWNYLEQEFTKPRQQKIEQDLAESDLFVQNLTETDFLERDFIEHDLLRLDFRKEDFIKQPKGEERIERERSFDKNKKENIRENNVLYKKLERINTYYAHKVSREILKYCKAKNIKVIIVPNYEMSIAFHNYKYLNTNPFRWQGRSIIRNLKYKAFQEGILVAFIRPYHISDCCSECGERIWRYNEGHKASRNYYGGQLFFCPNRHRGNAAQNTAKNIGRYFLRQFQNTSFEKEKSEQNPNP